MNGLAQHISSRKLLAAVWIALLVLLGITVASAYFKLGVWNIVINYGVAVSKMLLVMLFFMHLKYKDSKLRLFALVGFVWLAFLIGLTLSDYLTRVTLLVN